MMEVEEIANDLETRHGNRYTREQYTVWAHMIHLKKHHSRDDAPDKSFFRGSRSKKASGSTQSTPSTSGNSSPLPTGILPGKCIQLRSQSMQQLEMWHSLYEVLLRRKSTRKFRITYSVILSVSNSVLHDLCLN